MTMPKAGICFNGWTPGQADTQLAAIKAAGFAFVRCDAPTIVDAAQAILTDLRQHELKWLPLVRDASLSPLAGHPSLLAFEVWNEPNLIQPLDADAWVKLVRQVHTTGCTPTVAGGVADSNVEYAAYLTAAKALPESIAVAVHPYLGGAASVKQAQAILPHHDIWVTEFGIGTGGLTGQQRATDMRNGLKSIVSEKPPVVAIYSWNNDPDWTIAMPDGDLLPCGTAACKALNSPSTALSEMRSSLLLAPLP